ncbi:hypothetical protein OG937_10525 [Streptomyces sp. NBC_00510]
MALADVVAGSRHHLGQAPSSSGEPVTARHFAEGWASLPGHAGGVLDDLAQFADRIKLRVRHDGLLGGAIPAQQRVGLETARNEDRCLTGISWPS